MVALISSYLFNEHFAVWVPRGRAINPISKTNWEGTGVEPDIKVSADEALKTARLAAVNKVAEKTSDDRRRDQLKELSQTLQKELDQLPRRRRSTLPEATEPLAAMTSATAAKTPSRSIR